MQFTNPTCGAREIMGSANSLNSDDLYLTAGNVDVLVGYIGGRNLSDSLAGKMLNSATYKFAKYLITQPRPDYSDRHLFAVRVFMMTFCD